MNPWALAAVILLVAVPLVTIGIASWRGERRAKRLAKRHKPRIRFDEAAD